MGCIVTKKDDVTPAQESLPATAQDIMNLFVGNFEGQNYESAEKIGKLRLSMDAIKHIYDIFNTMNVSKNGSIDCDIFCSFFKVEKTKFTERCFQIFDKNSSSDVEFCEFILAIWNYCTFTMNSLILFAFNFYDLDGSGELTMEEIKDLIAEVYGYENFEKNEELQQEIMDADENSDGKISFDEFKQWVVKTPVILYPAFRMQQVLRRKVLGNKFWHSKRDQRVVWENRAGKGLTIYDILGDDGTIIKQMSNSQEAFANQMQNWHKRNPKSNLTNKKDEFGRRKKRTTVAMVPAQMKPSVVSPQITEQQEEETSLTSISETRNDGDVAKELEKLDEEIDKNNKILSKDKELKKIEDEMDL